MGITITTDEVGQIGQYPRRVKLVSTDNLATLTTANYLNYNTLQGFTLHPTDIIDCIYNYNPSTNQGMSQQFDLAFPNSVWQLVMPHASLNWVDITIGFATLASAGEAVIQPSWGSQQFQVRDIRVNYSAAGLSGGSGNRLLVITDGTTVYNNAGITAALLGTPVNTLWGGTGNPVAGSVAQNTPSVAGANIYAQYSGGTTDYTAGSISLSVLIQRVA